MSGELSNSKFSYSCNRCGLCCRDKVITLSPYDVIRIARAAQISTSAAIEQFTIRRGSILRFDNGGRCVALDRTSCTIHHGRPLACRLYPLGLERNADGSETYIRLEPAAGSLGMYGKDGTVADFLDAQGFDEYVVANDIYRGLLPRMRERIDELVDFERTEPREFWRIATREALAESNFDPNPMIDALFDADRFVNTASINNAVVAHRQALESSTREEDDASILAAAAVLLAVSLGYSPRAVAGARIPHAPE